MQVHIHENYFWHNSKQVWILEIVLQKLFVAREGLEGQELIFLIAVYRFWNVRMKSWNVSRRQKRNNLGSLEIFQGFPRKQSVDRKIWNDLFHRRDCWAPNLKPQIENIANLQLTKRFDISLHFLESDDPFLLFVMREQADDDVHLKDLNQF